MRGEIITNVDGGIGLEVVGALLPDTAPFIRACCVSQSYYYIYDVSDHAIDEDPFTAFSIIFEL